jgi:hypothetical protein
MRHTTVVCWSGEPAALSCGEDTRCPGTAPSGTEALRCISARPASGEALGEACLEIARGISASGAVWLGCAEAAWPTGGVATVCCGDVAGLPAWDAAADESVSDSSKSEDSPKPKWRSALFCTTAEMERRKDERCAGATPSPSGRLRRKGGVATFGLRAFSPSLPSSSSGKSGNPKSSSVGGKRGKREGQRRAWLPERARGPSRHWQRREHNTPSHANNVRTIRKDEEGSTLVILHGQQGEVILRLSGGGRRLGWPFPLRRASGVVGVVDLTRGAQPRFPSAQGTCSGSALPSASQILPASIAPPPAHGRQRTRWAAARASDGVAPFGGAGSLGGASGRRCGKVLPAVVAPARPLSLRNTGRPEGGGGRVAVERSLAWVLPASCPRRTAVRSADARIAAGAPSWLPASKGCRPFSRRPAMSTDNADVPP